MPNHVTHTLPLENLPKEGVVVDCSNRTRRCGEDELSQAEQLAAALPPGGAVVVKALNTVSGYFLEQVSEQSVKPVPIASDSSSAKVEGKYLEGESNIDLFPNPGDGCHPPNFSWSQPYGHGWA